MCRTERIVADDKIAEEVAVYNNMLPGVRRSGGDRVHRDRGGRPDPADAGRAAGVDTRNYVRLEVGPHIIAGRLRRAIPTRRGAGISAVHFVCSSLPADA